MLKLVSGRLLSALELGDFALPSAQEASGQCCLLMRNDWYHQGRRQAGTDRRGRCVETVLLSSLRNNGL